MFLRISSLAVVIALLLAPSADTAKTKRRPHAPVSLKAFASCASLKAYASRHAINQVGIGRRIAMPPQTAGTTTSSPAREGDAQAQAAPVGATPGDSFSQTNVQEQGVDEPDLVKTDGRTLFSVVDGMLRAVALGSGGPRLAGSVDLTPADGGGSRQLFLYGDRVVVISSQSGYAIADVVAPQPASGPAARPATAVAPMPYDPRTTLTEVDVSDPSAMKVVRTVTVDGTFLDARLNGGTARIVVNAVPRALALDTPQEVRSAPARTWLPRTVNVNRRTGLKTVKRAVACDDVRRTPRFSGLDALTVLTLDLDKGITPVDTDALYTDAQIVYASQGSLYLTSQRWTDKSETAIHRFDIGKPDQTTYRGSGVVDGTVLNQYALSEYQGRLRVATTEDQSNGDSVSRVTVMSDVDGSLARIGSVGDLGRGERIYAVRFIGDTAYVVTFRQVDPLYTIDLSRPAQPKVVGELKILGYSAYLHPVGDDLLLGIGQDASEQGRTQGLQVSLFDVRDPADPTRLSQYALGSGSYSDAEFDPHAFLWWAPAQLAVLPVQQYGRDTQFTGAIGLRVARSGGIGEAGRVAHQTGYPVARSVVAGGRLYTVSSFGVRASTLDGLKDAGAISFPQR